MRHHHPPDELRVLLVLVVELLAQLLLVAEVVLLLLPPLLPRHLQTHHVLRLELRDVVLLLVQEVLDLLLVDLDFHLVTLLELLHLAVLVPELGLDIVKLLLGDLPEAVDLVLQVVRGRVSSSNVSNNGKENETALTLSS